MKLSAPFIISPRLLPALQVGNATLSLEFGGFVGHRSVYRWFVDILDVGEFEGDDLEGVQGTQHTFAALLDFLSACGEGLRYKESTGRESENGDLFPRPVAEWARQHCDELGLLAANLEETPNLIEE